MMGAVESIDLSCCTPAAILYHIRGDAGASHLTSHLQPPALLFFFLFYFLETQSETGERGVKCNGKMSISGISKKVFKEEETHCCEGGCKCVD